MEARVAALASGAMIAEQVAGKAARDALFLSSFRVEDLPAMMVAAAVVSLFAAVWLSRLMVSYTPAKVVPAMFAVSGAGLLAEWAVSFVAPRIAAVGLYLHTALFGAVVISAFWSLINETFAPHTGRRAVRWITGGGTAGGVLGGIVAWQAAALIPLTAMLPLLAAINVICIWGSWRLQTAPPTLDQDVAYVAEAAAADAPPKAAGIPDLTDEPQSLSRMLWGTPYLKNLALVVALGAVTSGLLDYVFSAVAVAHYGRGPQLLAFFAKFWLVVGLLSFLLETLFGRIALEKLGLAFTVAILPAVVLIGSALGIAVPGLFSLVVLRGGEASQRNSLFRAAYELLYTPLSAQKKRAAKTFIDVACDRAGTVVAGGLAMAAVALWDIRLAGKVLLVIAMCCALASVGRSIPLNRGYVALLEEALRRAAKQMSPSSVPTTAQQAQEVALRDRIVEELALTTSLRSPGDTPGSVGDLLQVAHDLQSGEIERVRRALAAPTALAAPLVAFVVLLLADDELYIDAIRALVKVAPTSTGQLADALCNPHTGLNTRRRIPRVLSHCPTLAAAESLVRGMDDECFDVRYACGRALVKIRAANPEIVIAFERIVAIVAREVGRDPTTWDTEIDDEHEDITPSLVDRLARDRSDHRIEHVFNILALHLDPSSVRTAFEALHEGDDALRGTALEYLVTVLPDEIRDLVWPFIGEVRRLRAPRAANEIFADLVRAPALPAERLEPSPPPGHRDIASRIR